MSDDQKTALETAKEKLQKSADEANAKRTGKGTRIRVGATRGQRPTAISYEAFDTSKPETLPVSLSEFMDLTKVQDEKLIVEYLIDGYNDAMYSAESDPIAEYVNAAWPTEVQKQFRLVVRNQANMLNQDINDVAASVRDAVNKSQGIS